MLEAHLCLLVNIVMMDFFRGLHPVLLITYAWLSIYGLLLKVLVGLSKVPTIEAKSTACKASILFFYISASIIGI